jgi:predicted ATPase
VSDPELVLEAIAAALGVRDVPEEALTTTLAEYLRTRRTLLVLDNLEQIVDAAPLIGRLIDAAPGLTILGTSREPLRLRSEREFPVAPLPVPLEASKISLEEALASPAVQLFVQRAQAIKPGFTLERSNAADIVAICRRLDGLPLAIELAAARVRILPPSTLLARLDQRLALLTGGARDLPARQQTLRAAIAWSHDLLPRPERALFARLSVFAGGCSFEAAEAICAAASPLEIDLLDGIESLVQKSLVRQEEGPGGDTRFTMLQTIHEFALERFQDLLEAAELRQAHGDWFLALAESADWSDPTRENEWLDRLEAELPNLRQAIEFYQGLGELGAARTMQLVGDLSYFWWVRGHLAEGWRIVNRALATPGDVGSVYRADALWGAAVLAEAQGDLDSARRFHEEALALRREIGDVDRIARSLVGLGVLARQRGDLKEARSLLQEALETLQRVGDASEAAGVLLQLGVIRMLEGNYAEAGPELQESLNLFRKLGDDAGSANALQSLGFLALSTGELATAIERFEESLKLWRALGNQQMIATDLANLGEARHLNGELEDAETHLREARELFETLGDRGGWGFAVSQLGLLALDRGDAEHARKLLVEGLRLRWQVGERGAAADTLEALAEATWRLGDETCAGELFHAASRLRDETGFARQPVYEKRYESVLDAIADRNRSPECFDVDALVTTMIAET